MVEDDLVIMEAWALLANATVVYHTYSHLRYSNSDLIFSAFLSHLTVNVSKQIKSHNSKLKEV